MLNYSHLKTILKIIMLEKDIIELFKKGEFKSCEISLIPFESDQWRLCFKHKWSKKITVLTSVREKEARVFKTMTNAISVAKKVGFREVKVILY